MNITQIYENYLRALDYFKAHSDEAWFDGQNNAHERGKFVKIPLKNLLKFKSKNIGGVGLEKVDFISFNTAIQNKIVDPKVINGIQSYYSHIEKKYPNYLRKFRTALADESWFGGATYYLKKEDIDVSHFSIRTALRLFNFQGYLDSLKIETKFRTIAELGGGYGKTFLDFIKFYDVSTAYYIDLPTNMALCAFYAKKRTPLKIIWVIEESDQIQEGVINFVAPWQIHKIPSVDLFLNFLSMQHMTSRTQEHYKKNFIQNKVKYLFHQNRLIPNPHYPTEGALKEIRIEETMKLLCSGKYEANAGQLRTQIYSQLFVKNS